MYTQFYYYWSLILLVYALHRSCCDASRFTSDSTCKSPLGEVCIEIRLCPHFVHLLDTSPIPRPRHVIKAIRERHCGFHGKKGKVCCFLNNATTTRGPDVASNEDMQVYMENDSSPPKTTLPTMESETKHPKTDLLPHDMDCGRTAPGYRIMSGSKTQVGEFPWMVLIASHSDDDGLDFRCAGTLISARYVLTAAHCVMDLNIYGVRLGEHNVNTAIDCDWRQNSCAPTPEDIAIERVLVHENYTSANFVNDIALIRLSKPANLSKFIHPICLPLHGLGKFSLDGKFAVISGWGVTETGFRSPELLKTVVPIVPNTQCAQIYHRYANISDHQLCAGGYRGRDSCGGDSGGPLKYFVPAQSPTGPSAPTAYHWRPTFKSDSFLQQTSTTTTIKTTTSSSTINDIIMPGADRRRRRKRELPPAALVGPLGDSENLMATTAKGRSLASLSAARYVQFGIVSYGPRQCGVEGQPGVYTNVAAYIDWILDKLQP